MTSLSTPSRSCSARCPSSSWCCSCRPGQPSVPQVQGDHRPGGRVLRPQHRPPRLGHELTLERLQPLCVDRGASNAVCVPEASGGVVLLLLQTHGRETGRPSLLPGLRVAAQGVHTSPKVTRHTDGCLLPSRGHMWICEGDDGPGPGTQPTGSGQLCPAAEKQDPPSCKLRFRCRLQAMHSPPAPLGSARSSPLCSQGPQLYPWELPASALCSTY
uniref:Transmembrane protein 138 n=1 Tax=Myotis myotis TaxID=51298 RepID=A0A7J7RHF7_MYOMY|nr:transmembrane protein 138 [Myotis myotis]